MVVLRDPSLLDDENIFETLTIDLVKKPGRGLGFSIVGRQHDTCVFVSELVICLQFHETLARSVLAWVRSYPGLTSVTKKLTMSVQLHCNLGLDLRLRALRPRYIFALLTMQYH